MLRLIIITALFAFFVASPVEKDENEKIASENLRELLNEADIDKTNFGERNFEDFDADDEDESNSKQDSSVENGENSEEEPDETNPSARDFGGEEKAERAFDSSLASSMFQLDGMISSANPGLKTSKRSMEDRDMIDGDVKLDKESAAELVDFYKRNPQFLRLNSGSESSVAEPIDKRKVNNVPKWTFPINYRLQINSSAHRTLIRRAVKIWQQQTCISFVERSSISAPAINFKENAAGCWSYVGKRSSGINDINLQNGCKYLGIILHEIGHALGLWHEQSRQDRDNFVSIITNNIRSGREHNFLKRPGVTYGTPYDYGSVMHYSDRAFAKSTGLKTIVAKQSDYARTMGQRVGLSFSDIRAVNYHYCQSRCPGGLTWSSCRNGGYRDPNSCGRCKCPDGWTGRYCTAVKSPRTAGCGYRYRSATSCYRFLNSPGYFFPGRYTTSAECTWRITAPAGKRVRFQFIGTFGITCNTRCLDFVEVRYSSLSNTGPRFCCSTRPRRVFTSTGRVMLILFRTNSRYVSRGFRARFRYV